MIIIHGIIGCTCKIGFYNLTSLYSGGQCLPCFSECKSCMTEFICSQCQDSNSSALSTGGCLCNTGFYNETQVNTEGICKSCHFECFNCTKSLICESCLDLNSKPSLIEGCDCFDGFFKNSTGICQECQKDCRICTNYSQCTECKDIFSTFNETQCKCIPGYYNSSLTDFLNCSLCPFNCSLCNDTAYCSACSYLNMSPINGVCRCPDNSYLSVNTCIASSGYYMDFDELTGYKTYKCDLSCKTCSGAGPSNCDLCANNLIKKDKKCDHCESNMYYDSYFCLNCFEECSSCLNSSHCLSCVNASKILQNGVCYQPCPVSSYLLNGNCTPCPDLCLECNPICKSCIENANFTKQTCKCVDGYKQINSTCEKAFFYASFQIYSSSKFAINFSEPTLHMLQNNSFEFKIADRKDFEIKLLKSINNTQYIFSLKFKNSVEEGKIIEANIIEKFLLSSNKSQLFEYNIFGSLPSYSASTISPSIQLVLNSSTAMAQTVVSSSVGVSLMSNPAAAWALLNSIQILIFLPINSNNLTQTIKTFLSGFSGYNILPNVFKSFLSDKASSEPYLEAREYGIKSSVFLVNTGKNLAIFTVTCMMTPFIFCLSRCTSGKIAAKAIKILGNYKYSFFLRFWTQSFLELMIFAVIQLRSVSFI